jgi:hypothetical protein
MHNQNKLIPEEIQMTDALDTGPEATKSLFREALKAAQSKDNESHRRLLKDLMSPKFLESLDDEEAYQGLSQHLRLARVMNVLSGNGFPSARQSILALTQDKTFNANGARQEILIKALVPIRPSPDQAIAFWRVHCQPKSVFVHITVDALAANGSTPALGLLRELFVNPAYPEEWKIAWMRDGVLLHRHEENMLSMCDSLLRSEWNQEFKLRLVEALFDYRPDDWYLNCEVPEPVPVAAYSRESRRMLYEIGAFARANMKLQKALDTLVTSYLQASNPDNAR